MKFNLSQSLLFFMVSLALSLLLIIPWPSTTLETAALIVFILGQAKIIGHYFFPAKELLLQFILGLIAVVSFISVIGTAFFYLADLSTTNLNIITLLLPVLTLIPLRHKPHSQPEELPKDGFKQKVITLALTIIYLGLITSTLYILATSTSVAAIQSPWLVIPKSVFVLYFLSTLTLLFLNVLARDLKLLLNGLHFFTSLGVVIFIYPLGFGFDPFIHQATERIILETGSITPKPFYYIGQYSLVVWLAHYLPLSIKLIDSWLLPSLASLTLPGVIYYTFKYNFKTNNKAVNLLPFFFLLIPFGNLIQTTPQGISFLWSLIVIFLSLFYINRQGVSLLFILFLTGATLAVHPLSGIPLLFFVLLLGLYHRFWHQQGLKKYLRLSLYWIFSLVAAVIMPLVFILNSYLLQKNPININVNEGTSNPLAVLSSYYHSYIRPEDLIYFFGFNIRLLILIAAVGAIGYIIYKKRTQFFLHYIVTFLALISNYVLLVYFIDFDFLVTNERFVFPERILNLSFYFLLPFVLVSGYWLLRKTLAKPAIFQTLVLTILALFISISWYLSYPRFDYQVQDKGFSVSQTDFEAVNWIQQDGLGKDYVVLANQSVSAAAIQEFGFAKYYDDIFYYPVPTGDKLYQSYLDVVRNRKVTEAVLDDVKALTGVDKVYIVLNDYWHGFEDIVIRLKKDTKAFEVLGDEKIYIFSFTRSEELTN